METNNEWMVEMTSKVRKQKEKLPPEIRLMFLALLAELRFKGPAQPSWPHFGKLKNMTNVFHCHLNKGRPTYVTVWKVLDRKIKIMEVQYVGTHENAPY